MQTITPRYLFISHKSEDKPEVRQLVTKLESHPLARQHQLHCWLDERNQDKSRPYPEQFPEVIKAETTCAFLLFMPKNSLAGYVDQELQTAINRRNQDAKQNRNFPIFPVYPNNHTERLPLPDILDIFNYWEHVLSDDTKIEEIVYYALGFTPAPTTHKTTATASTDTTPQWLRYHLETNPTNTKTIKITNTNGQINNINKNELITFNKASLQQAFPEIFSAQAPERIRIMTDDAELAMLPWTNLQKATTTEVSPYNQHYASGFDVIPFTNPLAAIPANPAHAISAGKHYTAIIGYINSYLGIRGPIPRATHRESFKRELVQQQPDFIYIYAHYENKKIHLDTDHFSSTAATFTLTELGEWVKALTLPPVVIINLLNTELDHYPETLARSSRLLWIQSSKYRFKTSQLEENLVKTLEKLDIDEDIVSIINQCNKDKRIRQHLWINGQSPCFNAIEGNQQINQLRAALLRVMLGRNRLKNEMYGAIKELMLNNNFLVYGVCGDEQACPFDFPAQLQQRLDWQDPQNGLPIIPFYFSLNIEEDKDPEESILELLDHGLLMLTDNIETAFQNMLEKRGLQHTENCIALNWMIKLPTAMQDEFPTWLQAWSDIMHDEITHNIPDRTLMLSALCVQVSDQSIAQAVQDNMNRHLRTLHKQNIQHHRIDDALGRLREYEIMDFFNNNPHWYTNLKLANYHIDSDDYAAWLHERTQGAFDDTVNLIWDQYRNHYQDYPQT